MSTPDRSGYCEVCSMGAHGLCPGDGCTCAGNCYDEFLASYREARAERGEHRQ